jgi:hypothetical protein
MMNRRHARKEAGESLERGARGEARVRSARSLTELRSEELADVSGGGHMSSVGSSKAW